MNKPVKTLSLIKEQYVSKKVCLQEIIDLVPSGTDHTLIKIEPLDYELGVTYPIYKDNPNYENEMVKYNLWRIQRINELERELKELKPEPGRLPDDNDD